MTDTPRGVDDDNVSATESIVDLTVKILSMSGLPTSVKQEMVVEDSTDHISDGGVQFPGQEKVNEDSVNHLSDGGVHFSGQEKVNAVANSNDSPQDGGVRWSGRNKTPGRCMVHRCKANCMLMRNMRGLGSPR